MVMSMSMESFTAAAIGADSPVRGGVVVNMQTQLPEELIVDPGKRSSVVDLAAAHHLQVTSLSRYQAIIRDHSRRELAVRCTARAVGDVTLVLADMMLAQQERFTAVAAQHSDPQCPADERIRLLDKLVADVHELADRGAFASSYQPTDLLAPTLLALLTGVSDHAHTPASDGGGPGAAYRFDAPRAVLAAAQQAHLVTSVRALDRLERNEDKGRQAPVRQLLVSRSPQGAPPGSRLSRGSRLS
jgi:hypothetical protein